MVGPIKKKKSLIAKMKAAEHDVSDPIAENLVDIQEPFVPHDALL